MLDKVIILSFCYPCPTPIFSASTGPFQLKIVVVKENNIYATTVLLSSNPRLQGSTVEGCLLGKFCKPGIEQLQSASKFTTLTTRPVILERGKNFWIKAFHSHRLNRVRACDAFRSLFFRCRIFKQLRDWIDQTVCFCLPIMIIRIYYVVNCPGGELIMGWVGHGVICTGMNCTETRILTKTDSKKEKRKRLLVNKIKNEFFIDGCNTTIRGTP